MPRIFTEVRIDLDLNKQHPCWIAIRLQKIIHLCNYARLKYNIRRTRYGIHIRIFITGREDRELILKLRALCNDDYDRWQYDLGRTLKKTFMFNNLFNWRWKYWEDRGYSEQAIINLDQLLQEIIEMCLNKVLYTSR